MAPQNVNSREGIFFVSKAADVFTIDSGELRWIVDNERDDMVIEQLDELVPGTRVRFDARPAECRPLEELFERFTQDHEFSRSRTVVWAAAHPDVRLVPTRMNRAVEFMVERARRAAR